MELIVWENKAFQQKQYMGLFSLNKQLKPFIYFNVER